MKVTHELAQQSWIVAVLCKEGGMRLAHMPQQINIGTVVRGMESDFVRWNALAVTTGQVPACEGRQCAETDRGQ